MAIPVGDGFQEEHRDDEVWQLAQAVCSAILASSVLASPTNYVRKAVLGRVSSVLACRGASLSLLGEFIVT